MWLSVVAVRDSRSDTASEFFTIFKHPIFKVWPLRHFSTAVKWTCHSIRCYFFLKVKISLAWPKNEKWVSGCTYLIAANQSARITTCTESSKNKCKISNRRKSFVLKWLMNWSAIKSARFGGNVELNLFEPRRYKVRDLLKLKH